MSKSSLLCIVCSAFLAGSLAAQQFPNGPGDGTCPSNFPTGAAFKIAPLFGAPMTVSNLTDPATIVGRSNPFIESDPLNNGAPICSAGVAPYPNTLPVVGNTPRRPPGWPVGPATRRQVHTEILSLSLTDGFVTIRAGQPFYNSVNATPQARFFRNSTGEVASNYGGNPVNTLLDFPAKSFFNVFVEVDIPGMSLKLYNKTPLILSAPVTQFPPNLNLPNSTYIHDPSFGAVPLFDGNGLPFGWLLSAGHGSSAPNGVNLFADAFVAARSAISFCVDDNSLGLDPVATGKPNDVFGDAAAPAVPLTLYQSPDASQPGVTPDMSNEKSFAGILGGPPAFAIGDAVNSISFGRDGTLLPGPCAPSCVSENGTLMFSVSRDSQGRDFTDVNDNALLLVPEAAADVYMSAVPPFGRFADQTALLARANDNILVSDSTLLGLRPRIVDGTEDNVTGLELWIFNPSGASHDFLYCTLRGPSFGGNTATIFIYDPTLGPFQPSNLTPFALAPTMGLSAADQIDALALSDVTAGECPGIQNRILGPSLDEVLFSLSPASPSLWGTDGAPGAATVDDDGANGVDDAGETGWPGTDDESPATIFKSTFNNTHTVFRPPDALGLLTTDDVDAIDIQPDNVPNTSCPPPLIPFCIPGQAGVINCPCSNPPISVGAGCNNYGPNPPGGTGGAFLTATGDAVASVANTVVFHVSQMQTPSTIVILFMGSNQLGSGAQSGAGVRCVSGLLTPRPYKSPNGFNASSIDFPTGSFPPPYNQNAWTRSSSPSPGTTRHYYAAYRNPQAGSHPPCTPTNAFNLTNAGSITWHL